MGTTRSDFLRSLYGKTFGTVIIEHTVYRQFDDRETDRQTDLQSFSRYCD